MDAKRLIITDSNSIIHRAYHALPPLTTKKGEVVGAVYGFLLAFFKAIKEFWPDFVAATFDFPAPTFRHKKYKEYKAKRPPAPAELFQQIPKVKEVLMAFNVPRGGAFYIFKNMFSLYLSILTAGFGGGVIRGLVGFIKHQFSYKNVGFNLPYFATMMFLSDSLQLTVNNIIKLYNLNLRFCSNLKP